MRPHAALVMGPKSISRCLRGMGEPTDVPKRTPARGPPYDLPDGGLGKSCAPSRCRERRGRRVACATGARRPRCALMQLGGVAQPPCQGGNRLVKGVSSPRTGPRARTSGRGKILGHRNVSFGALRVWSRWNRLASCSRSCLRRPRGDSFGLDLEVAPFGQPGKRRPPRGTVPSGGLEVSGGECASACIYDIAPWPSREGLVRRGFFGANGDIAPRSGGSSQRD